MPTLIDVAKKAGVSPITVSRVINKTGHISPKMLERVNQAIAELGYVPNELARSLRLKRTNTLALILTDITNPFFTIIARGVEDTANQAGYNVIFYNTDESVEKEKKSFNLILQNQVDGVLLVPATSSSKLVDLINEQGLPLVVLDRAVPSKTDGVQCDSTGGAYQLVKLLIGLGHRRITMINGPVDVSTSLDRLTGYKQAMAEAGLQNFEACYFGRFEQNSGYELTKKVMAQFPRPTALFAANNLIAIGTLMALHDLNLRVPEDVAVVGFDDLPLDLVVKPFLTVVAQPAYEMGKKATELLIERINGARPEGDYQSIVLPVELIVRASSGKVI